MLLSTADLLLESATWLAVAQCPLQKYMTSTQPSRVALAIAARHPSPCLLLLLSSSHILPQSFCWHLWHSSVRSFLPVLCSWAAAESKCACCRSPPSWHPQSGYDPVFVLQCSLASVPERCDTPAAVLALASGRTSYPKGSSEAMAARSGECQAAGTSAGDSKLRQPLPQVEESDALAQHRVLV